MPKQGPFLFLLCARGWSRDSRPAPILMSLPSMAGLEDEFLLLEIWCLQTHSRGIQGSEMRRQWVQGLKEGEIRDGTRR